MCKSKNSVYLNHSLRLHIFTACSDKIKLADCAAYGAHTRPHSVANAENEYVQG